MDYQQIYLVTEDEHYITNLLKVISTTTGIICRKSTTLKGLSNIYRIAPKQQESCILIFDLTYYKISELVKIKKRTDVKIVVVGGSLEDLQEYLAIGINGFLTNKQDYNNLLNCILSLKQNPLFLDQNISNCFLEHAKTHTRNLETDLTPREIDVLSELSKRKSYKQIGESLDISLETVKTHLDHIYSKLDVSSKNHAIQRAKDLKVVV